MGPKIPMFCSLSKKSVGLFDSQLNSQAELVFSLEIGSDIACCIILYLEARF